MNFNFYGNDLLIVPNTGVVTIDVQDLYSEWKQWVVSGNNASWPQAFDVLGGDPLSPGINAGSYFFLRNDLGWRIRPAEENANVYVVGNLVPRDSAYPILIPTTGNYTVLYAGLQPITQSVEELLISQQTANYDGKVHIDTYNGYAGTVYPYGTNSFPVNNLQDAMTIVSGLGFDNIVLHGSIALNSGEDYRNINFIGDSSTARITFNMNRIGSSTFLNCQISGALQLDDEKAQFINCFCHNMDEVNADFKECVLDDLMCFNTGTHHILYCMAGSQPCFAMDFRTGVNFIIRNWAGPIQFAESDYSGNLIMMDSASSHIIFAPDYTAGQATIYGVGQVTNNSSGTFVPNTQLLEAPQIDTIERKVDNVMAVSI